MRELEATVQDEFATVRDRLERALSEQGFGVLTEVDVQATFKNKLGVDHEPHVILGVCNPELAKQALDVDRDVALLLPCTTTLRWTGNATEIKILDPEKAFMLASEDARSELEGLAGDVRTRLAAALRAART
jgi:uncharacterized protein (DUF302 family)